MQDEFTKFLADENNGCSKAICEAAEQGYQAMSNYDIYVKMRSIDPDLATNINYLMKDDGDSETHYSNGFPKIQLMIERADKSLSFCHHITMGEFNQLKQLVAAKLLLTCAYHMKVIENLDSFKVGDKYDLTKLNKTFGCVYANIKMAMEYANKIADETAPKDDNTFEFERDSASL